MGFAEVMRVLNVLLIIAGIIFIHSKAIKNKIPRKAKVLLTVLAVLGIFYSLFRFLVPLRSVFPPSGEMKVANVTRFYSYDQADERWQTSDGKREVPVKVWFPENEPKQKHPLLLFSHGANGVNLSNESLYLELASRGYVVMSLDHPGHSFFTKLSDGRRIMYDRDYMKELMNSQGSKNLKQTLEESQRWLSLRTADINAVIEQVKENKEAYPELEKANREKLVLMGHSLGGSAVLQVGREEASTLGVIALESPYLGDIIDVEGETYKFVEKEYPHPVLHIYSEATKDFMGKVTTYDRNNEYLKNPPKGFRNLQLEGVGHLGLTDFRLTTPIICNALDGGLNKKDYNKVVEEINQACLEFLESLE